MKYSNEVRTRRLADAAAIMELTAEILIKKYAVDYSLVYEPSVENQFEIWRQIFVDIIKERELLATDDEPYEIILKGLLQCINEKRMTIAVNTEEYTAAYSQYVGFIDHKEQFLHLRPFDTYRIIKEYWTEKGKPFRMTEYQFKTELKLSGYLIAQVERNKTNNTTAVRIDGKHEERMLRLDLNKIESQYGKIIITPFSHISN